MERAGGPPEPRRAALLLVALVVVLGTLPGQAAAETRAGGTVVVEAGETVTGGLEAFGGTVLVRGTVEGDVDAAAGNVRIQGEVTGDVDAAAGNVWIAGSVGGDVDAAAGNVYVAPGAEIGGSLSAAAGNVVVAGTVRGDADLAGGTVTLAAPATIGGNVEYAVDDAADFQDEGATVDGTVTRVQDAIAGPWPMPAVPGGAIGVVAFVANLLLGALLLLAFPGASADVAGRVTDGPLRTAGVGLLTLVAIPVLILVLLVTVVGIPLAIAGAMLFGLLLWLALVYGRFAVGAWVVSLAGVDSSWAGLVVGLAVLGLLSEVPVLGVVLDALVVLLGLGAVVTVAYAGYRARRA